MAELKDLLDERRKMVDKKATQHREVRDDWNEKTKEYTGTRNELNNEVRELIVQVREQRDLRDQMNEMVREKKKEREEANKSVRDAKDAMRDGQPEQPQQFDRRGRPIRPDTVQSLTRTMERLEREFEQGKHQGKNERKYFKKMKELNAKRKALKAAQVATESAEGNTELREAMALQEAAHNAVKEAAEAAQSAHDNMLQWNAEVDRQREKAEAAHRKLRTSKKEADKEHSLYIVSLRCLHSIQDILRAMRGASAGQGQRGSNWQSEKGKNLIISILKKNIKTKVQYQFEINMRVSMAILITLKTFGIPNLSVKWPNDILSDNKKISGVLIQLLTKKQKINQAIIGIGVNVNQTHFNNLPQASSMKSITGTAFDIEALTTELMAQLKHYFDVPNMDKLMSEYESVLFRKNKPSSFVNPQGVSFLGTIQGVSKSGMLRVKSEKAIEEFDLKSIQMLY